MPLGTWSTRRGPRLTLIKRWWHAKRGKVTLAEVDLRVGGSWRWVIVTNDGFEVAFHGVYREIVANERLVYTEVYEGAPGGEGEEGALNTLTFTEVNGRTTVTTLVEAGTQVVRDAIIDSGMEGGYPGRDGPAGASGSLAPLAGRTRHRPPRPGPGGPC